MEETNNAMCHIRHYSIKINGKPRGNITPSRGLQQEDPLSPYLFLLCAEGLSSLISQAVECGQKEKGSYMPWGT